MEDVMEEDDKAGEEGASRRVLRQLQRIERWVAILDSAASQGEETRGEELGASLSENMTQASQHHEQDQGDAVREIPMGCGRPKKSTDEKELRRLRERATASELQLEAVHEGIKVKREKMEEHFAREAQLQSEVMAMSQSVVQLTQTLAECKETLECCVCLERPVRFVAVPCGHHFCGHSSCYSSKMVECPTCRTQITGRTELFGACSWLAEMFDNIDAANVEAPGGGGMAVEAGTVNRQVLPGNDLDIVEKAISGAEQLIARVQQVIQALLPTAQRERDIAAGGRRAKPRAIVRREMSPATHDTCHFLRQCAPRPGLASEQSALQLRQRASVNEMQTEALLAGVKVKREEMDESFAKQAQLASTVSSMSEIIMEHKSRLAEFKEALECCICFERSIRYVCIPCGHCFCFHGDCCSSELVECATCRQQISATQELFGACTWLADLLEGLDSLGERDLSRGSNAHQSDAECKQILSKIDGFLTTADKVIFSVEEATRKMERHLEEHAEEEDVTASVVLSAREPQKKLASPSDESDLEEGEVRDTDDLAEPQVFEESLALDEFKHAPHELEEGELPMEALCGEAFAPTDDEAGVSNQRSKKSRMSLCPSWILDSCLDRRCPHAHGYQAEMCPDLYRTSIWGHITIGQSDDSSGRLCVRGQYCSYAHSHKELQEMLDSSVMYRDIDRVRIVPKLCSAELGKDRCVRGSACPFAHSTQELVTVLDGAAIYRRVEREVYLQPDRRPRTARRSILCRHWVEGRCRNSDLKCEFAHGVQHLKICMFATGMNKCPRDQECAFFHPRDVSEQLAVVCPGRRPATLSPRTVHVAGILKTAQIADVRCLLEPFGEIEDIRIHEGHGSALITFADTSSGVRAINILNLIVQIPGADQPLTVQWSHHAFETPTTQNRTAAIVNYCFWCFTRTGFIYHHHTEATCYAKIRLDYQTKFQCCSTVQSVLDIVSNATEKGFDLLLLVITPAFCKTAEVSSQPEDADSVAQVVEKLLALVKGSIEQHEYDSNDISRQLSRIWWSLGTLSKQLGDTLFQQFRDTLNLLEAETMRTGFLHPLETPRILETRSFVSFLRAKSHLGRHAFISNSHEQAVKDLVSQHLERFTTRDLCQAILALARLQYQEHPSADLLQGVRKSVQQHLPHFQPVDLADCCSGLPKLDHDWAEISPELASHAVRLAGSLGPIEFYSVALTLAKEADCHGVRPQVIALAQTFAKEKEYLVPEFPARELASTYRIFAMLRQDPGSSFLAALDRRTWELMQILNNIDARFILRYRREIHLQHQSATRTLSFDIYDALRARVADTKHQDREYDFYRKSEGEWDDLHCKPVSFFTPEVLATIFRRLSKSFALEDAEFEPETSASAVKENYLRHLGALTDRLRQAICAGLFGVHDGKHLSIIWMSFGALSSVFPWMQEHFCSDTLALLENQTIKQRFICADASTSVRGFATFVRVKSGLRRHRFASDCDETFMKDFFLREMGNFNVLDLCQTVAGFSNFMWTQKLGDGLQVALNARICELLHSFGPLDLCMCCTGLVGLHKHFVCPFNDIFSKFALHAVRIALSLEDDQVMQIQHAFQAVGYRPGARFRFAMRPLQPRALKDKDDSTSSHRGGQSHEEFARSFALNQKILKSKSLDELQDICKHNVSEFNGVNVATACRRFTKLFTFNYKRNLDSQGGEHAIRVLSMLFSRMKGVLAVDNMAFGDRFFSTKSFSTIWWTCGTLRPIFGSRFLHVMSDDDLDVLETKTIDAIVNEHDKFEGQTVATFLWAKVRMERFSFVSEIRDKALQTKISSEIENFNAIDLSQTIWALAKITCSPAEDILCRFKTRLKAVLHTCGPIDLSNSVFGLHKLQVDLGDLVPSILSRAKQVQAGWTLNEMCGLMYPLAKLVKGKKLDCALALADVMDLFVETILASGEIFRSDSQHISIMFMTFRCMSYSPSPIFMSAITRRAHECKSEFSSQGVSMMLQALAECPEFATEDLLELLSDFIQFLPKTVLRANTQELCEMFAALAKILSSRCKLVEINAAVVIAAVVAQIRDKLNEFTMLDLVRVGTGIVTLGCQGKGEDGFKLWHACAANIRVKLEAGKVHGQCIEGWDAFLVEFREKIFVRMRTSDEMAQVHFSVVIRILAYIANTIPTDVEEKLVLLAKDQMLGFDSHDVNISLWSIAHLQDRLSRFDRGLISMIIRRGVDIALTLHAHACSNCVWGLAIISNKTSSFKESSEFLRLIEDRVITLLAQSPEGFQLMHVKNLLCGMARLQYTPKRKLISVLLDRLRCIPSEQLLDQWRDGDTQLFKKVLKDLGHDSKDRKFLDLIDSIPKQGLEVLHMDPGDGIQGEPDKAEEISRLDGRSVVFVKHGGEGGAGRGRPVPAWKTRPAAQPTPASLEKEGRKVSECKIDGGTHLCSMANEGQPTLELRSVGGGETGRGRPVPVWQTRPNALAASPSAFSVDKRSSTRSNGKHQMDEPSDSYPLVKRPKPSLGSEEHLHVAKGSVREEARKEQEERGREDKEREEKGKGKERDETSTGRHRVYGARAGNEREEAKSGSGERRGDGRDCDKDRGQERDRERECDRTGNGKGHSVDRRQQRDRDRGRDRDRERGRTTDSECERDREWSKDRGGWDRHREERDEGLVQAGALKQQRERDVSPLRGRKSRHEERDREWDRIGRVGGNVVTGVTVRAWGIDQHIRPQKAEQDQQGAKVTVKPLPTQLPRIPKKSEKAFKKGKCEEDKGRG